MDFTQVAPAVFTATLDEAAATVSLVVGRRACLLVDTGSSPKRGAEIRAAASQVASVPLTTVVVTHGHWDHAFGLAAFGDLDTVGQEELKLAGRENRRWARDQGVDPAAMPLPRERLSLIGVRDLGEVTVEIAHLGPAHTDADLILALPGQDLLIVGDLVEEGPPQFDETSSLRGWVATLDALYSMLRDDTVIIPGHGSPLGPGHLTHFRTGLAAIWDQAEWAFRREVPVEEVYGYDDLEWPWDRATAEEGIALAYRELAARPASGPSAAV